MSRFRRYFKKRRSSRVVKMKFQSFVDIATQADNMQIISVNAGGKNVIERLGPFFSAYKYYKLGGVSIKLIPASTLPVDPLGLSYSSGEQTVDPRDQLTPGMCRITNGEDILEDITGLNGDQQRDLYNNMLLDPRWYKWMLQSGVKRYAKPRYWQIGQLHQDKWPGIVNNIPLFDGVSGSSTEGEVIGTIHDEWSKKQTGANAYSAANALYRSGSSPYGFFQTGHRGVLGWLPTDGMQLVLRGESSGAVGRLTPTIASPPEVELFKILMPPMHKTNYFYRMFITETVYFREPIVMNVNGFRPIDVFHASSFGLPVNPQTPMTPLSDADYDKYSGGNDGSD